MLTLPLHSIFFPHVTHGFGLLFQGGVRIYCCTNVVLSRIFEDGLRLSKEQIKKLDVFFLDGKPVDEPEKAIVPTGSRLALAAGLPGIAGLAMRSGSPLAGLRPGITYMEQQSGTITPDVDGWIDLALFSLALGRLDAHFCKLGFVVSADRLSPMLRPSLGQLAVIDGKETSLDECRRLVANLPPGSFVKVQADFSKET